MTMPIQMLKYMRAGFTVARVELEDALGKCNFQMEQKKAK